VETGVVPGGRVALLAVISQQKIHTLGRLKFWLGHEISGAAWCRSNLGVLLLELGDLSSQLLALSAKYVVLSLLKLVSPAVAVKEKERKKEIFEKEKEKEKEKEIFRTSK
jgi:hypothetical protein